MIATDWRSAWWAMTFVCFHPQPERFRSMAMLSRRLAECKLGYNVVLDAKSVNDERKDRSTYDLLCPNVACIRCMVVSLPLNEFRTSNTRLDINQ
jgi:hypothetical protein